MTISEQEQHAASVATPLAHFVGLKFKLGELDYSRSFSSKWDAETWFDDNHSCRLYEVYRPRNKPTITKLTHAKN